MSGRILTLTLLVTLIVIASGKYISVTCNYLSLQQYNDNGLSFDFYCPTNNAPPNSLKLSYDIYSLDSAVPLLERSRVSVASDFGGFGSSDSVDDKYHKHLIIYSYEYTAVNYTSTCSNMVTVRTGKWYNYLLLVFTITFRILKTACLW